MTDLLPDDDAQPAAEKRAPGEYVVVARRYRPQTFDELVGQEHVAEGLKGAIETNRVGHAFLFTGARGVGKTSAARILAKALNCIHGPTPTPCNKCEICQAISAGEDIDALEIDGASNRRIEEIRQLRQNVGVRPSRARFKIYIIDEVHMLTNEAFNALLKTLEEPPEHVKFIFCTTEPEKIPITILSRCQRFDFVGIQPPQIIERLHQIAVTEGVQVDPEALELLARRAAGSMRDSQSLLEQLLAFGRKKITASDVHAMLGTAQSTRLTQLVQHLVERNAAAALAELDAAVGEGVDVGQLLEQLLGYLRDCMAAAVGCAPNAFRYTSSSEAVDVARWTEQWTLDTILAVMQILDQTLARLRYSMHARMLAEMAVVRICNLEDLESLSTVVSQLREGSAEVNPAARQEVSPAARSGSATPQRVPDPAARTSTPDEAKKKADLGEPPADDALSLRADAPHDSIAAQAPPLNGGYSLTPDRAPEVWQQALAHLSDILADYASFSTSQAIPAPNRLVVSFTAKYNSCKAFCERPDQVTKLESALAAVTGQPVKVEFSLVEGESDGAVVEPRRPISARQRLLEKAQHPLVARALELFQGQLVRVEEPEG